MYHWLDMITSKEFIFSYKIALGRFMVPQIVIELGQSFMREATAT